MDECSTSTNASDYMEKLDPPTRKRYKEKLKVIGGVDPYCIEGDDANSTEATFPNRRLGYQSQCLLAHRQSGCDTRAGR